MNETIGIAPADCTKPAKKNTLKYHQKIISISKLSNLKIPYLDALLVYSLG